MQITLLHSLDAILLRCLTQKPCALVVPRTRPTPILSHFQPEVKFLPADPTTSPPNLDPPALAVVPPTITACCCCIHQLEDANIFFFNFFYWFTFCGYCFCVFFGSMFCIILFWVWMYLNYFILLYFIDIILFICSHFWSILGCLHCFCFGWGIEPIFL